MIDDILSKHLNPSEYEDIPKIIINVLKKNNLASIEKITKFFTSHFDISYQDHLIFRSVFQIGLSNNNLNMYDYEQIEKYLYYCIGWFCSQVKPNYYKIYMSENYEYVLGYRYGNILFGKIIN